MENKIKTILVASFVQKSKLDWFLNNLYINFNIKKDNVFFYEIEDDDDLSLLTFKIKKDSKVDLKFYFENATVVNIKSGCIFSINGLNRLIEYENCCEQGNISYEKHTINWCDYENKLILSKKNNLVIKNIKKTTVIVEKT